MVDPELLVGSIDEIGRGLREGAFTSRELTGAYLERLETVGEELNAVVTLTRERALSGADRADRELEAGEDRGALHGIPYGVKDLIATEGDPTTWGAEPYREQVTEEDAAVVERLEEAGAVLLGKLATIELAGGFGYDDPGAAWTGATLNPWDRETWAGGSSSGPAAATAAGLVGFAIGTETWGSLTTPAAFSGVTAVRPTYDRVSREGVMALSWTMDKVGPLCRSASGCETVLRAIADPETEDVDAYGVSGDRPRIAVPEGAGEDEQEGVRENFERSLGTLSGFAEVERISLPELPYAAMAGTIIDGEAAAAFDGLIKSGDVHDLADPVHTLGSYRASTVLARDYINANRVRAIAQRELDALLAEYDALVTPARSSVASRVGESMGEFFGEFATPSVNAAANVTGLPGVTVPNGFAEDGLPTGVEVVSRAWEESAALAVACAFERRSERPPYADLLG